MSMTVFRLHSPRNAWGGYDGGEGNSTAKAETKSRRDAGATNCLRCGGRRAIVRIGIGRAMGADVGGDGVGWFAEAQVAIFQRGANEGGEQRVRGERLGFEFGVELAADEPRMVGHLDDFDVGAVRRAAGDFETSGIERRFVFAVEFVAMAVALGDFQRAVGFRGK